MQVAILSFLNVGSLLFPWRIGVILRLISENKERRDELEWIKLAL
jgi:hypothetical protein